MLVVSSKPAKKPSTKPEWVSILNLITEDNLKQLVKKAAMPRHYIKEYENNCKIASWLENNFQSYGLATHRQGQYHNIIATFKEIAIQEVEIVIGAHYDSVPGSFGADDNASALAALLTIAQLIAEFYPNLPIAFIAFNREEDNLLGSRELVQALFKDKHNLKLVHILEMLGYADDQPGTQMLPSGLPIKIEDRANFIAVLANHHSNKYIKALIYLASHYLPDLPVKALKIFFGLEKYFPVLLRSDHRPFWEAGLPALMWTDTSEYRNANYHKITDIPDTLNYTFLKQVTQLLLLHILYISLPFDSKVNKLII